MAHCLTSPTVSCRGYHAAPAEAARLAVSRKAGPHPLDTPDPHPSNRANSRGTTTADEGRRPAAVYTGDEGDEEVSPERGGPTEEASVSRAHVFFIVFHHGWFSGVGVGWGGVGVAVGRVEHLWREVWVRVVGDGCNGARAEWSGLGLSDKYSNFE